MKTSEITKFLKNQKTLIVAIAVVVVLVVCWYVFGKDLWRKFVNEKSKSDSENYTGTDTTPYMNFANLRDRIMSAVSGPGTDEDEIYAVLSELNTQADWEYLQRYWENSMSKKNIGWGGLILSGMLGAATTLKATLKSELDRKELQHCRDILSKKNIDPGF